MSNESDIAKNNSDLEVDTFSWCVEALNACVSHATEHYGTTMSDLALLMDVNKWTFFKWIDHGRMPIHSIKAFEDHCHARYVTRHLAECAGMLLVPKAKGLETPTVTLLSANQAMATAISQIATYMESNTGREGAIKAIDLAMEALAVIRRDINE